MTGFAVRASVTTALGALAATLAMAGTGLAQPKGEGERAQVLQRLLDCRKEGEAPARLACFDAAAASLDKAEAEGDLVVMDRAQVGKVRREAFGFSLPSLRSLKLGRASGGQPAADEGALSEGLDRLTTTAKTAYRSAAGKWVIVVAEGGVWMQTDSETLLRAPKAGSRIEIRGAMMGSYFMNVDGQRALRVKRIE